MSSIRHFVISLIWHAPVVFLDSLSVTEHICESIEASVLRLLDRKPSSEPGSSKIKQVLKDHWDFCRQVYSQKTFDKNC